MDPGERRDGGETVKYPRKDCCDPTKDSKKGGRVSGAKININPSEYQRGWMAELKC